jgi:hypothetical protein
MSSLRALYETATPFDTFLADVQKNRDLWQGVARRAIIPEDVLGRVRRFGKARHLLVISEDWCGDAVNIVPWVAALAADLPNADLRLIARDRHLDVMDEHLTNGSRSIPVVIVIDEEFTELGWWGPRPRELQAWAMSPEARALDKDIRYREMRRWYAQDRGRSILAEVLELLERTAAPRAAA